MTSTPPKRTRRPSQSILSGAATLNAPTPKRDTWAINYKDPVTGKQRNASGGKTEQEAERRAREILGWNVPEHLRREKQPPTLEEAFDSWMNENRRRWNSRTWDNYSYVVSNIIKLLGNRSIATIKPADIKAVDLTHLSREQQKKIRSLLRGMFKANEDWTTEAAEKYAAAVTITGTASSERNRTVPQGDIPTANYVNSVILCAYSTNQPSPVKWTDREGEWKTEPHQYTSGLPAELVDLQRRGIPKHYKNLDEHKQQEDKEIASRFRQYGLITALGAGGGLRIGEILALRVRHILDRDQLLDNQLSIEQTPEDDNHIWEDYKGKLHITEQASQASKGKIWLTAPKGRSGGRARTVNLPALLPPHKQTKEHHGPNTTIRQQAAASFPRFNNPAISLWNLTFKEARLLWTQGYPPLALLLWQRISELWNSEAVQREAPHQRKMFETFGNLLLFPTRNPPRTGRDGEPNVLYPENWNHDARIVEGTGGYQSTSNLAGRYMNPLYDYVSEEMGEYPAHRTNKMSGRRGWTHHGFRHYAIQTWIESAANIPLTKISEQAGHASVAFTLQRYAHPYHQNRHSSSGGLEI